MIPCNTMCYFVVTVLRYTLHRVTVLNSVGIILNFAPPHAALLHTAASKQHFTSGRCNGPRITPQLCVDTVFSARALANSTFVGSIHLRVPNYLIHTELTIFTFSGCYSICSNTNLHTSSI